MNSLQELTHEAVQLLYRMVAIPSVSRDEKQVADVVENKMNEWGLNPHRVENNVWCVAPGYDAKKPTLLLNAHIDTVKPATTWTKEPFAATLEDGRIYGLGTNDDGASVVSLLQTFRCIMQKEQSYNLIFLASAEEEVSGKNGIELALTQLPPITMALVGEPTGMQPAIAEKGLMVVDCTAHGKSGHAARNEGVNAIYIAMDDIQRLRTFAFEKVSPLLGPVKMTTTIIQAGTQHNVIPDECKFTVDIRSNEMYSNEEILHIMREHLKSDATPRSTRLCSSSIDQNHAIVQRAIEMGKTPFGSPTLSDQALMRCPSIKMGPGNSARSHTADEYITIDEIEDAIATYIRLLDGLRI